jgi:hypothetical protein
LIWVFDNRVPQNPMSISTFPTPAEADYKSKGGHFGDVFVDAKGVDLCDRLQCRILYSGI